MKNQAVRIGALVTAVLLVLSTLTFATVLALTGHLDSQSGPYVAAAFVALTTSVPALIAVATTQGTQAIAADIHGLVNGNYSQAMRVLAEIGRINPSRRSSDAALDASHVMDPRFVPPPPSATPIDQAAIVGTNRPAVPS
jgi:hypothetical protein